MRQPQERKAQIYTPPGRPEIPARKTSFFLAGTTAGEDWRSSLINSVLHLPIIVFNPLRRDWDSSWREDATFGPFREQVEWELEMQEKADAIVLYFGPGTDAPVSLLELGLCARSGKAVVACHKDYKKRGNVQIVCRRFGIELVETVGDLAACVVGKVAS
ncbi:hypothetical protein BT67DRAFT_291567 [Trichocladium antarcticum]|uniref:Nucleoside 2-deoxyribosyltransferase n=1 Tax=Trichocladium antarcticum TaxID=1450529 RepID=A0AAN6ZEV4_9PEZI|nr:hypothetical protein BT67DRAFT_291567 [Trichocladium antarcticum]